MFPPGNATAAAAIRDHLRHREQWYARLVGPLLVHADRWSEFVRAHEEGGRPPLSVVVIGTDQRPQPVPAEISVVGLELMAPDDVTPLLDSIAGVALEIPGIAQLDTVVEQVLQLRSHGVPAILKYRTGGTVASAFPPAADVARVVATAVRRDVPVKFTAGLHDAVRHRDPATGFEHHGFLNLLVAVGAARSGVPESRLVDLIDEQDAAFVAATVDTWPLADVAAARSTFASFGCCGVGDPVAELVALGLVHEEDR